MERFCTKRKAAFTLLELMVVMGVMALLFGFIGFSLSGSGTEIKALQRELISMILKTRNLAISEGVEARLAVRTDAQSKDHFLRYFEIYSEGNVTDSWIVREDSYFLPQGLWIVPDHLNPPENFEFPTKWFSDAGSVWSGTMQVGSIESSEEEGLRNSFRKESAIGDLEFSYLAFDHSGRLFGNNPPKLVFSAGEIRPKGDDYLVKLSDENDLGGILLHKLGGVIPISSNDFSYD